MDGKNKNIEHLYGHEIIFGIVIIIIASIVLIGLSVSNLEKNCIPENNCNKPSGEFSVQPNSMTLGTVNLCSYDGLGEGTEPCVIRNIPNLSNAVNECNKKASICDKFIYPDELGPNVMRIVYLNSPIQSSSISHMYTRQVGVTFRGN